MAKRAIAIACHPDDIEFMMAGTLIRLKEAGYEIHYMNIADGALGGNMLCHSELAARRRSESKSGDCLAVIRELLGCAYHVHIDTAYYEYLRFFHHVSP